MAEELRIEVRLRDFASKELSKVQGGVANVGKAAKASSADLGNFGKSIASSFSGAASSIFSVKGAITSAVAAVASLRTVDLAADIESVSNAFGNLTKDIGGATAVLEALRRGTRGTVSDFKLMETANKAVLLGVAESPEQFEKLTSAARRLGRAVGRDSLESFNDLAVGIGRQSRLILDNLGLIVKEEDAYKKLADAIGTTVQQLTDEQKRQAFLQATLAAVDERLESLGAETFTLADGFGQLTTEATNLRDELLKELTPALTGLTKEMAAAIKNNKPEILGFFADTIEVAGNLAQSLGQIAGLIDEVTQAWKNLGKIQIPGVTEIIEQLDELGKPLRKFLGSVEDAVKDSDLAAGFDENRFVKAGNKVAEVAEKTAERIRKAAAESGKAQTESAQKSTIALEELIEMQRKAVSEFDALADNDFFDPLTASAEQLDAQINEWIGTLNFAGNAMAEMVPEAEKMFDAYKAFGDKALEISDKIIEAQEKIRQSWIDSAIASRVYWEKEHLAVVGAKDAFFELEESSTQWGIATHDAILDVADALSDNLTDGIMPLIDGTKDFKEAFRDTAKSILTDIARIIVQTLILKAVQGTLGGLGGAIGGFAKGGVIPGGVEPVRGLAGGDVIRPPGGTFRIGEGKNAEAVVPLPDNRSIPVKFIGNQGRGGDTFNSYVTINMPQSRRDEDSKEQADRIAAVVTARMERSFRFRSSMEAA